MPDAHDASSKGPDRLRVQRVQPAYQQVADQIRLQILDGTLAAGDRLPNEIELSELFGVSRSTVREALRVLASRDLIRTLRGTTGGTFVARVQGEAVSDYLETSLGLMWGSEDLSMAELLEARETLEVPIAGYAARRFTPAHIARLREALEREKASRTRSTKFREHRDFHGVLAEATGNRLLEMLTDPIFSVLRARSSQDQQPDGYWDQVDVEHAEIADAIETGDPDKACAAMAKHFATIRNAYGNPVVELTDDL